MQHPGISRIKSNPILTLNASNEGFFQSSRRFHGILLLAYWILHYFYWNNCVLILLFFQFSDDMGLSPLSPTPLPSGSAMPPASTQRPISAMSQPVTASGYMLPQGAMPLPGLTTTASNGVIPNSYSVTSSNNNNYGNGNNLPPQHQNGHLNGPVSHSSPRVADPYYWNQYWWNSLGFGSKTEQNTKWTFCWHIFWVPN